MAVTQLTALVLTFFDSASRYAFAVAGLVFLYGVAVALYRLYFHPLAKYPGPLLGRLSTLYDGYHAYQGDKHVLLHRLHEKYGVFVRITPNILSINHPDALKTIYGHGANVQKAQFYRHFRATPAAISAFLAIDKAQHARKRRVISQAFSDAALKNFEQHVIGHVQELTDRIDVYVKHPAHPGDKWSISLDMQQWCSWLVFDVMGDLVFGKSFSTLGNRPNNREGIRLLGRAARRNYTFAAVPNLSYFLESWMPPLRGLFLDRNAYLAFGKQQMLERTSENSFRSLESGMRDIFSYLLSAKDPLTGEGFSTSELWMESNTLIVAGSDTSSTTLGAALFYLTSNPDALTRLVEEIHRTFASRKEISSGPKLQSCTWLRACIDETLRLSPGLPGTLPREVLRGGLRLPELDVHLPAGVDVGVPIYSIQRHAAHVSRPSSFEPDRWLDDASAKTLRTVFTPFSLGPRGCVGRPLVMLELTIALACLVWEFDMRLGGEQHLDKRIVKEIQSGRRDESDYHYLDFFLASNSGPYVQFRARDCASFGG